MRLDSLNKSKKSTLDKWLNDPIISLTQGFNSTTPEHTVENPGIFCNSDCSKVKYPGEPIKYGAGVLATYSVCQLNLGKLLIKPRKLRVILRFDGSVVHVKVSDVLLKMIQANEVLLVDFP